MVYCVQRRVSRMLVVSIVAIFVVAVFSIPVLAASLDKQIDSKQDTIEEINKKIKAYQGIISLKKKQQDVLNSQIESINSQTTVLEGDIQNNRNQITNLDAQISTLESRITEKSRLIGTQRQLLSELIRAYYSQRGQIETAPVFLGIAEAKALVRQNDWTESTGSRILETLDSIQSLKENLIKEREDLTKKRYEVDSLRQQLEQRNEYLDSAKQSKQVLVAQTQSEAKKYSSIVSDLQKQRDEIEQEIESLEAAKISQLDLSKLPEFGRSLFIYPVQSHDITQSYGKTRFAKTAYASGFHNGIDFGDSVGTPVYAAASGTVSGVGNNGKYAYGKWVAIDHGNGLTTLYGHFSAQSVKKGDKVNQGQKIGLLGNTGYSTGPHTHFSVFATSSFDLVESKVVSDLMIPTGASINPKNYLPK